LHNYDGIIGLDWLAKYSPILTHWAQQWIAFQHDGQLVVLHGEGLVVLHTEEVLGVTHALIELHVVQTEGNAAVSEN